MKKYTDVISIRNPCLSRDVYKRQKLLAVKHLKDQKPIDIIDNIFQLHYLENRGAAFGILDVYKRQTELYYGDWFRTVKRKRIE